ncbi:MAG: MerR family DNA-binding transcriptional regulator [Paracoccaceae bacterium]
MTDEILGIRAMCDMFNVTARTLRFYEQKELLFPQRIGHKRLYNRRDRARLTLILRGRKFGVSLEEIRQLLDLYDMTGETEQIAKVLETVTRRREELIEQRKALDEIIDELSGYINMGNQLLAERKKG